MEMNGQLHVLDTLLLGKQPMPHNVYEAGLVPQSQPECCGVEKNLSLPGIKPTLHSLWPITILTPHKTFIKKQ
jgi:hypothetical protein